MSSPHFGHFTMPGRSSFHTLERLLSLRAFDTFLFGTAITLHLLDVSLGAFHTLLLYNLFFVRFVLVGVILMEKCFKDGKTRVYLLFGTSAVAEPTGLSAFRAKTGAILRAKKS